MIFLILFGDSRMIGITESVTFSGVTISFLGYLVGFLDVLVSLVTFLGGILLI
jgi:hypothetical protein